MGNLKTLQTIMEELVGNLFITSNSHKCHKVTFQPDNFLSGHQESAWLQDQLDFPYLKHAQ